jgi:hypothetical protein
MEDDNNNNPLTACEISKIRINPPSRVRECRFHVGDRDSDCRRRGSGIRSFEEVPDDLGGGRELASGVEGERESCDACGGACSYGSGLRKMWRFQKLKSAM